MLELYHGEPNTFSLKPLIVLHEKDLRYVSNHREILVPSPFERENLEVKQNPEGDGPVLVDQGTPMTESFFISLYLDERHPSVPLRPTSAWGRWRVLMWARFVNEVLTPAICTLGCHKYLAPELAKRDRSQVAEAIAAMPTPEQRAGWQAALDNAYTDDLLADSRRKIELSLKKIEDALAQSDWLAGGSYSLADIDAYAFVAPASDLVPELLEAAPRTKAWVARIGSRSAVKAARAMSKTGAPQKAFTPGTEHSRWG